MSFAIIKMINIPNIITTARVLFIPFIIMEIINKNNNAALILFFISAATDFFDGFFARRLNQQTLFGKNLDSFADLALIYSIVTALILSGQMSRLLIYPVIVASILFIIIIVLLKSRQTKFGMPHLVSGKVMTFSLFVDIGLYLVNFKYKDILFLITSIYIIFYVCIDYIRYALNIKHT